MCIICVEKIDKEKTRGGENVKENIIHYLKKLDESIKELTERTRYLHYSLGTLYEAVPNSTLKALIYELKLFTYSLEEELYNISYYIEEIIDELKRGD